MSNATRSSKRNPCPICQRIKDGDCRVFNDTGIVNCKTYPDSDPHVPGYKFSKPAKDPMWGVFHPTDGVKSDFKAREPEKGNPLSPTERNAAYERLSGQLGDLDAASLKFLVGRGLTLEEIYRARSLGWVMPISPGVEVDEDIPLTLAGVDRVTAKTRGDGLLLAGVNLDGDICGYQIAPMEYLKTCNEGKKAEYKKSGKGGKYLAWSGGGFGGNSWKLPNDEQPMTFFINPDGTKVKRIMSIEGYLKAQVTAFKLWRTDEFKDVMVVGRPGCAFSCYSQQIDELLARYPESKYTYLHAPDAGSIHNGNVLDRYAWIYDRIPSVKTMWWNQDYKNGKFGGGKDLDELTDYRVINYLWGNDDPVRNAISSRKTLKSLLDEYKSKYRKHRRFYDTVTELMKTDAPRTDRFIDYQQLKNEILQGKTSIDGVVKILNIRAPMGTGKTQFVANFIADRPQLKFLLITPRNSLGINSSERIPSLYHLQTDLDPKTAQIHFLDPAGKLAFCPNSLESISDDCLVDAIVILDEWQTLLNYLLTSSTLNANRDLVMRKMAVMLANAKLIISLDANLTEAAVKAIEEIIEGEGKSLETINLWYDGKRETKTRLTLYWGSEVIENSDEDELNPSTDDDIRESKPNDKSPLIKDILKQIALEPILIFTDSLGFSKRFAKYLEQKGYKVLVINSKTTQDNRVAEFLKTNGETGWKEWAFAHNYDAVICTPTIESGVSIDLHDYFGHCYGLFFGVIGLDNIFQMLGRLRDWNVPRSVFLPERGLYNSPIFSDCHSPDAVFSRLLYIVDSVADGDRDNAEIAEWEIAAIRKLKKSAWGKLWQKAVAKDAFEKSYYRQLFVEKANKDPNWQFSLKISEHEEESEINAELKKTGEQIELNEAKAVKEARKLSDDELKRLKKKTDKTQEENYQIEHTITDNRCSGIYAELTPEEIKKLRKEKYEEISQVENRLIFSNPEILKTIEAETSQRCLDPKSSKFVADLKSQYVALRLLRDDLALELLFDLPDGYNADTPELKGILKALKKDRHLQALTGVKITDKSDPVERIGKILNFIGLTHERRERNGEKKYYVASIETELFQKIEAGVRYVFERKFGAVQNFRQKWHQSHVGQGSQPRHPAVDLPIDKPSGCREDFHPEGEPSTRGEGVPQPESIPQKPRDVGVADVPPEKIDEESTLRDELFDLCYLSLKDAAIGMQILLDGGVSGEDIYRESFSLRHQGAFIRELLDGCEKNMVEDVIEEPWSETWDTPSTVGANHYAASTHFEAVPDPWGEVTPEGEGTAKVQTPSQAETSGSEADFDGVRLKVGDKVTHINPRDKRGNAIGTIAKINERGEILVSWDDGSDWYYSDRLILRDLDRRLPLAELRDKY